jgi:hypothetical protein
LQEWVWVVWHCKGASLHPDDWFRLPSFDREVIKAEVERRIEEHNDALES